MTIGNIYKNPFYKLMVKCDCQLQSLQSKNGNLQTKKFYFFESKPLY